MLYSPTTKTLTNVVAPGVPITEAELRELAGHLGKVLEQGPIELVSVVFVGGREEAEAALPQIKRFGLQCRAVVMGAEEVLYEGSRMRKSDARLEGTLLPVLREASWPHVSAVVHRRLLPGPVDEGPWVTFGWDTPTTIARFEARDLAGRTIADVEAEAIENLVAKERYTPKELKPRCIALSGEYCSEAILAPDVMKECARALGSDLICVSVPKEKRLVAVPGLDVNLVSELLGWSREMFDGAEGRRISPLPILVQDGAVVGLVSPRTEADAKQAPGKKPWYKFW